MAISGKMTFDEVNTALKNLPLGEHKLIDIVAIIEKCETFTKETLNSIPIKIDQLFKSKKLSMVTEK